MVEKELVIVGCSGIEDKLQDDVQGVSVPYSRVTGSFGLRVWLCKTASMC